MGSKMAHVSIEKKVKSINGKFQNIVSLNDKIISIDKNSRIVIYDSNLKKLNSIKIYNRKIYKNYNLKFEIAVDKNSLFIADNLGNIYSYDLKNLDKLWVSELGVPFKSSIKIYKNQIFIIGYVAFQFLKNQCKKMILERRTHFGKISTFILMQQMR